MNLYSAQVDATRTIALCRLALASCALLAASLDPAGGLGPHAGVVRGALACYVLYSATIALGRHVAAGVVLDRLPSYAVDLVVLSVVALFGAGAVAPIAPLVAFSVITATVRWDRRASVWAIIAAIGAFAALPVYQRCAHPQAFDLGWVLVCCASVATFGSVLDRTTVSEERREGSAGTAAELETL
jgi:hypothetical protein